MAVGRLLTSTSDAPLEFALYDRVLHAASPAPAEDIVIVAIDEASITRLGEWPWARDVHAGLIDQLHAYGARVVAFTTPLADSPDAGDSERIQAALALLESSDLGASQQEQQLRRVLSEAGAGRDPNAHLAQAIAAHGGVIAPLEISLGHASRESTDAPAALRPVASAAALRRARPARIAGRPHAALLKAASAVGHTYLPRDADGVVRTDLAAVRIGDALIPSLAVAVAARAAGAAPSALEFDGGSRLAVGAGAVALDSELRTRPRYLGAANQTFARIPYWEVAAGRTPTEKLRNKIVLIGFTESKLAAGSDVATPADAQTPAVLAVAGAASSLMTGAVYARPALAAALEWFAAAGAAAFAAFALPSAGVALGAAAAALLIAVLLITEVGLLSSAHLWAQLTLPCLAVAAGYAAYAVGETIRRANAQSAKADAAALRSLGQTFQRQGQLDLAFETYQRCPLDAPTMDLLYQLGLDFERRRQTPRAAAVYAHIARRDPDYRDLRTRRARLREEPEGRTSAGAATSRRAAVEDFEPHIPEHAPSRTLGRYQIERELGKGAMGVVYLGRDPNINRVVAIKAIPLAEEFEEEDLAEARARFFREAEMAGRLNHPAIVTVYDAGEDQGLAYIAMEYLRGEHLSHFTDVNRLLPPKTVMLLAARVADALHYAHRQNVVHRDIKPANIMFNPDTDELKITDFGIARLTDTSRTKTGIVLGTPSFMSPEQLEGRTLDGRSDQFALGVSLYQLLCGQLPFRAESMPRLMQKIATEPHASIRLIRPDLPACVEQAIDRTLAKSADDRYATCGEFAAALRECAASLEPQRATEQAHEWLIP